MRADSHRIAGAVVFAAIAFAGLLVRLESFSASLWLDEYSTLWAVEGTFRDVLSRVPQVMLQSPFGFVIIWASIHLFGESEAALRLPSLLAAAAATAVLALGSRRLWNSKTAFWVFGFFWLCYPAVWTAVDARPYALALLFGSLATIGFLQAAISGDLGARVLWIAGAAGLVWTHYVFIPYLATFLLAYSVKPGLRARYPAGQILTDLLIILGLVLPVVPLLLRTISAPAGRDWLFEPRHLGVVALVAPLLVAAVLVPRRVSTREGDLRFTLWAAVVIQIATLEAAGLVGAPVISRYAVVVIVPLVLLAASNLTRMAALERGFAVAWFAATTSVAFYANTRLFGSPSGAGYQEWREAVQAIEADPMSQAGIPVLFRSGNAEDDAGKLGVGWPASLAPLRAPGTERPDWTVLLLTYRWTHPERRAYFENVLVPRLAAEPVFYLLCLVSDEPGTSGYCADVRAWIEATWKGGVRASSLGQFSQLEVLRFERRRP